MPALIHARFHTVARALLLAGLALAAARPAAAAIQLPTDFANSAVVGGLNAPTSFAFLPDGRVLFVEQKTARVRMEVSGHIASTNPVLTVPSVNIVGSERGLLGIAVDPEWPARPYVYLYHNRTPDRIRLVRYTAAGDLTNPAGENLTLALPLLLIDDIVDATVFHQAGCVRFGPDGMLYVSLGDDAYDCLANDVTSLHGQIIRLKVNALPAGGGAQVTRASITPPDNPFVLNPNTDARLVFAYGLRNPWRFQIDPVSGVIYGCDVGDNDFEEENEIRAGNYMGWPYREGNMSRVLLDCPEPGGTGALPYVAPIAVFARDASSHAVVSGGMYRPAPGGTNNWPAAYYPNRGDVFYTDYFVGDLKRITWNGSQWLPAAPAPGQPNDSTWASGFTSATDFLVGPDGSLWWLAQYDPNFNASSGTLNRIRFTGITAVDATAPFEHGLRASPNPFAKSVELSFRLGSSEHVRLSIFDLSGRRVRALLDGEAPAGETRVKWDGFDAAGRIAPAGMYFARLDRAANAPPTSIRLLHGR